MLAIHRNPAACDAAGFPAASKIGICADDNLLGPLLECELIHEPGGGAPLRYLPKRFSVLIGAVVGTAKSL